MPLPAVADTKAVTTSRICVAKHKVLKADGVALPSTDARTSGDEADADARVDLKISPGVRDAFKYYPTHPPSMEVLPDRRCHLQVVFRNISFKFHPSPTLFADVTYLSAPVSDSLRRDCGLSCPVQHSGSMICCRAGVSDDDLALHLENEHLTDLKEEMDTTTRQSFPRRALLMPRAGWR